MMMNTDGSLRDCASSRFLDNACTADRDHCFKLACIFLALFIVAFSSPAQAAQINYGTHQGANFVYVNVTEDSGADEPLPLYGAPIVTGDSIDFNPLGFDAATSNGGSDVTNSNLVFMIVAKIGNRIDEVRLSEAGATTLAGNVAPGSSGTASAVFASGVIDIHDVDFAPINHISVPFSFTFSPSGGTYFLGTDGGGGPLFNTEWTGSVTIPVESILMANGFTNFNGATRVSIDLGNRLDAVSQAGTTALMAKMDFGALTTGKTVRADIPEPASVVLAALGLLGLFAVRRRCKSSGRG